MRFSEFLLKQLQRRRCRFNARAAVKYYPTAVTLDKCDVCNVVASYLINALNDLEKPEIGVELRISPQTGVCSIGRFGVSYKIVNILAPYRAAFSFITSVFCPQIKWLLV